MIVMHSYTFRDYPVERALRKAKAYGYDALELSPCHWNWSQAEMVAHFEEAFGLAEAIGLPIQTVDYGGDFMNPDPAVRGQAVTTMIALIQRVRGLGVTMVNGGTGAIFGADRADWTGNGSAAATDQHWQLSVDSFKRIAEAAERAGVLVTLEVHMNTLHDTAATTVRLLDAIGSDHVKAAIDCGNMWPIKRSEAPAEAVRILGSRLGYFHLKNCHIVGGHADYGVSLNGGDIDYYSVLQAAKEQGYAGHYCIEYCGLGDPSPRAEGDLRYLKSLLSEVGL